MKTGARKKQKKKKMREAKLDGKKFKYESFVNLLNLQSFYSTSFDSYWLQQSSDAIKTTMLYVTGWLQALTISYLIGSFEIMMMPKDIFFFRHDYGKFIQK